MGWAPIGSRFRVTAPPSGTPAVAPASAAALRSSGPSPGQRNFHLVPDGEKNKQAYLAMGQNPALPVNIPIPTKMD